MEEGGKAPHVAVLPSPGMGHLIPLAEIAKILVLRHHFTATFVVFSDFSSHAQTSFLDSLPAGFSYLTLPPVPLDDLPPDAHIETRLSAMMERSVPSVRNILRSLQRTTRLAAYVIDLFGGDTLLVAKELGVPHYLFFTSNFMALSLLLHLPELDRTTSCEYRDLPEPVALPGCVPVRGEDLFHPIQDRANDAYRCILNISSRIREVDGIVVNSFVDLEPEAYRAFKEAESERELVWPPVYPVGPVIHCSEGREKGKQCLLWLDEQPRGSVLFVSFGSGGTLSTVQVRELAWGLEASGRRFLWVVRCPNDREASGAFFSLQEGDDPLSYLPEGFVERTRGVGLVVPLWAPQVAVLAHGATGGFLTHCGWNSTLESVVHGVPMIAWPLYAEQRMNAVMLVDGVGVALRPKEEAAGGLVRREEVAEVVKELMEREAGKKVMNKVQELKAAAARAVDNKDGSSYRALAQVAKKWMDAATVTG